MRKFKVSEVTRMEAKATCVVMQLGFQKQTGKTTCMVRWASSGTSEVVELVS